MAYARQFFKGLLKKDKAYPWTLAKLVKAANGGTVEEYLKGTKIIPKAESADKLNNKTLNEIFSMLYPVGTIMEFDRPMNMSATYGGIWELYGTGRMTVGIDTDDADFNAVDKTGGSKEMQKHKHDATTDEAGEHRHSFTYYSGVSGEYFGIPLYSGATQTVNDPYIHLEGMHRHAITISETGSGNAGNLPPYIVVYRYRKVAD